MMPDNEQTPAPNMNLPAALPASPRSYRQTLTLLIAVAALVLAGWQWLETRQKLADTQQEVTRRLAEAEAGNQEERGAQKQLREQIEDLQSRLGAFEGKLNEFQGQSVALQSLYQDIARSREEALLLEVEQAITLAGQQLQLAGNVPVALLALQTADARLARLDRPAYLPLRKALAKDIERLNVLPFVDQAGISLRLEQVVLAADRLPLVSYGRPSEKVENAPAPAVEPWWQRAGRQVWQEIKDLVRIQRFDGADPALLAPGQEFFLRENLKLRLLNARLALFSRDQATFRNELKQAQSWLGRHFVADDKAVLAAQATLGQMAGLALNSDLPNLSETQGALRSLRGGKEKR